MSSSPTVVIVDDHGIFRAGVRTELADRVDVPTAVARLHDRGLDTVVATFAVEVWRYALGMLAADAEPPSLTNSLEVSTRQAITDEASFSDPDPTFGFVPVATELTALPPPVVVAAAVVGVVVDATGAAPVQPSGLNTRGAQRAMLRASARPSARSSTTTRCRQSRSRPSPPQRGAGARRRSTSSSASPIRAPCRSP